MIDNDLSKSIESILKGVSGFLIRQVEHEDIWYFSHKMKKGRFLLQAMKEQRKDHSTKLMNKHAFPSTKHVLLFLRWEKFLPWSDVKFIEQLLVTQSLQNVPRLRKTKHPIHIMVFGVVTKNGDIKPSFTFPHGL